jgi:hypothetical protein
MPRIQDDLITIIGSAYLQPIADLIDRLIQRKHARPTRIQSTHHECGYCASGVILLVAMFESYVSRLRYTCPKPEPVLKRNAVDIVLSVFPRLRHREALRDVYVLRDILMHAHLWEIKYELGGPVPMVLKDAILHQAYGDTKYRSRVDLPSRRTKALKLSVIPTRIDRRDLLKVFDTVWKTLLRFESVKWFMCNIPHRRVRFRGKAVTFESLRDEIEASLQNRSQAVRL